MLSARQGQWRATEFVLQFRILAAESGWNKPALKVIFCQGLNKSIHKEMACRDNKALLNSLIDLIVHLDNLLYDQTPRSKILMLQTSEQCLNPCIWGILALHPHRHNAEGGRSIFTAAPRHTLSVSVQYKEQGQLKLPLEELAST